MSAGKLPPQLPAELGEIRGCVVLCGYVARRGTLCLNQWQRERLTRHCGRMPKNKSEAARWKIGLRALAKEVAAEPDPEAQGGPDAA